jgi:HrpA-like RNA helicase
MLQVLVLHSLVPREEQDLAMRPALLGHCKVILSTNIAESSVTIPDVVYVIDSGLHRGIFYDDKRRMPSLLCTWCAQASARQRSGRAGRVAPGTIIHLFTKQFHEKCMSAFDEAEILRSVCRSLA